MPPSAIRAQLEYVGGVAILAGIYVVTAKLGFIVASIHPSATTIWAPTGISFAALLLAGFRYWPGVFAGAFLANFTTEGTVITSIFIALGNTLEAITIAHLVTAFANGIHAFERLITVGMFFVAAVAGGLVSATVGVGTLTFFGFADPASAETIWTTWLLGNLGGAIVVAPVLLAWWNNPWIRWGREKYLEVIGVSICVFLTAYIIFGPVSFPFDFLVAPVLVWTIMRFSTREAMTAFAVLSLLAVIGTLSGYGPFASLPPGTSLLYLQTFIVVVGICILALSATVAERRTIEAALRNADRAKDAFLATLSHELRNPLTTIVSYAQLLSYGTRTSDERLMLDNMQKEIVHITHLLEDLLDLSRIRRGRMILEMRPVDIDMLVHEVSESVRPIMLEHGHAFSVESEGPCWISGDPTRVKQMIVNLLTNAAKYTDNGGSIHLSSRSEDNAVVITVSDTGIGISRERLPFILEEKNASDPLSVRYSRGGLGIGLTLVKRLATLHGGTLSVRSAGEGEGSTFIIRLPQAPKKSVPQAETLTLPHMDETVPAKRTVPLSIFVVDDNRRSADAFARLLQTFGYDAQPLYSGRELLKRLESGAPDIIILDLELGDTHGYAVAEKIRNLGLAREPRLIAISGYTSERDTKPEGIAFAHHFIKPVNIAQLREILSHF